jgi:hypothetical protein
MLGESLAVVALQEYASSQGLGMKESRTVFAIGDAVAIGADNDLFDYLWQRDLEFMFYYVV